MAKTTEDERHGPGPASLLETDEDLGPPARRPGGWRLTLFHLMMLVLGCALLFRVFAVSRISVYSLASIWLFLVPLIVVVPVAIVAWLISMAAHRESQRDALLWVLAIAAEKGLPLAPGLYAVADQFSGRFRRQTIALANWLNSGLSLPDAMLQVPGLLPASALVLTRVGWQAGDPARGLREAARSRTASPSYRAAIAGRLGYLFGMLLWIQSISGFILYFIVPKFEAIFADFQIRLPELTIFVIGMGHALSRSLILPILSMIELAVLIFLPLFAVGWVRLPVPLVGRLSRRRHVAILLRSLAITVEAGRPISLAIDTLAASYPERWMRKRLRRAYLAIEEGGEWWRCLGRQGLIRPTDAAVLESAQRTGNLAWAMREIADSSERRLAYRLQALSQLLFPLVVIAMGALVFLLAGAYFWPLITLIQQLADL